jgi:hypothetical protein
VLSGVYNGHLDEDTGQLRACLNVVVCTVALQVLEKPLRVHDALLYERDEEGALLIERKDAGRMYHDGLPLGDHKRDIRVVDGRIAGPGNEPDGMDIDTGCTAADFEAGDQVLAWWWGLWWRATVQHVSVARDRLQIRWAWSNKTTGGYLPRLVRRL